MLNREEFIHLPPETGAAAQGYDKMAAGLRSIEELNRTIIASSLDCIKVLDLSGKLLSMNEGGRKLMEIDDLGRHLGKSWIEFWQEKDRAIVSKAVAAAAAGGRGDFQAFCPSEKGTPKWWDVIITPIRGAQGMPEKLLAISRDISERVDRENLTKESERQLQAHIANTPVAVISWDKDLNITQWAGAAEKMFGWSSEETVGKALMELGMVYEEDIPLVQKTMAAIREPAKGCVVSPNRNVTKDGRVIHCIWYNSVLTGEDGEMASVMSLVLDVTEQREAEKALMESEANLRAMLDNLPYLTWLKDSESRYKAINKVFADYLRLESPQQAVGKTDLDLQPLELAEKYRADDALVMKERKKKHVEEDAFDGTSVHWVETYKAPIIDEEGKLLGTVGFARDITEQKRIEQELIILNKQLSHEVAMRTADLSALTAHVQKIAETERARLAAELHDELGSTLVGINMAIAALKSSVADKAAVHELSSIEKLVVHANNISRSVINQLYPTVLDNCGLVAAIEWQAQEFKKHSGITVELDLPEGGVDAEQTFALAAYRITQECLTNIAKHAKAGKVRISLKAQDGFMILTIKDDGIGLPAQTSGGHGILGMIERAKFLGGSMELGSEPGHGTTARLRLPLAPLKPEKKMRVLVVDDHSIVRDAIRRILESETDDFTVEGEAADGEEALRMALGEEWDLVLLDISLPKKNGAQVLEEIVARKPDLPVIMLSSHSMDEYAQLLIEKGAACYLEKGKTDGLVEAMRRAVMFRAAASG